MRKHSKITKLVVISFMSTLEVLLTRIFAIFMPTSLRLSLGFLPVAMTAILYGPWWAGVSYALGDIIGMLIFPMGPYFPGFTLTAFLTGMTFGLVLYGKPVTFKRTLVASLIVVVFCNLILDTFWLYLLFDQAVIAMLPLRLVKSVLTLVLQTTLIPLTWNKYISKIDYLR
jgi:ECF transporter S component (folate family)